MPGIEPSCVGLRGKTAVDDSIKLAVEVLPARADVVVFFELYIVVFNPCRLELMHKLIRDDPAVHIPAVLASDNRLINIGRIEEEALTATLKLSIDQVNGIDCVFAKPIASLPALFGPIFS